MTTINAADDVQEAFNEMQQAGLMTVQDHDVVAGDDEADDAFGIAHYYAPEINWGCDEFYIGYEAAADNVDDAAIAGIIIEALVEAGFDYEWDGDTRTRVKAIR